jgi:cell division septum initiation protein DivIVA
MSDVDLVFGSKGAEQVAGQAERVAGSGRKLKEEFENLSRGAMASFRQMLTPVEKLEQQIQQLEQAMKTGQLGKLSVEQAEATWNRLKVKLGEVKTAAAQAQDELERKESSRILEKSLAALEKYPESLKSASQEFVTLDNKIGDFGAKSDEAFGGVGKIGGYAAAVGMAYGAVAKLKEILADVRAENERLAAQARDSIDGEGGLAQLAGSQQEYDALLQESRGFFAMGAGTTRDESAKLLFDLQSAGLSKEDRALFAEAKAKGVVSDAGDLAGGVAAMKSSISTSSTTDLVDKILAAGSLAPGSAAQVARAAGKAGVLANQAGVGENELLASIAVLAKSTGSPEEGGTLGRSLFKSLDKAGMHGDLAGMLKQVQERVAGGEKLRDILGGDTEAISAYGVLTGKGAGQFSALTKEIGAADAADLFSSRIGFTDTSRDAALGARQSQQGSDVSESGLERGADQNDYEAVQAENRRNNPIWGRMKNAWMDTQWLMSGGNTDAVLSGEAARGTDASRNRMGRTPFSELEMRALQMEDAGLLKFAQEKFGAGGLTPDELERSRGMYEVAKQALDEQKKTNSHLEKLGAGGGLRAGAG